MANQKLTDRTTQTTLSDADLFATVDVSDLNDSPEGTSKKTLWSLVKSTLTTFFNAIFVQLANSQTITGDKSYDRSTAQIDAVGDLSLINKRWFDDNQTSPSSRLENDFTKLQENPFNYKGADFPTTIKVGERFNLWSNSEDMGGTFVAYGSGALESPSDTLNINGIKLTKITGDSYFSSVRINESSLIIGRRYMYSFYAVSPNGERFIWNNTGNNTVNGHSSRYLDEKVRRISFIGEGVVNDKSLDLMLIPTVALGSGTNNNATLACTKNSDGNDLDIYIGGFQIEEIDVSYNYGIVWIGDSTIQGSAGTKDLTGNREIPRYVEGLLNVNCFNRGVGGNTTTQMVARYATDITPLSVNCNDFVIQGGINDIGNAVALATIQTNLQTLYDNGIVDGMRSIMLTCTINDDWDSIEIQKQQDLNDWIKTNFEYWIDIADVVEFEEKLITGLPSVDFQGDGVHYGATLKKAIASNIVLWEGWDFLQPSTYQKTTTVLIGGNKVELGVYTVAALPSGFQGDTAIVTDATTPTYLGTLTGGGAVVTPVFYNGTNWVSN